MFAFLAPLGLKLLFGRVAANAKADVAAIPPKVKVAMLAIALLAGAYFLHQHIAHKRLQARYDAGYAQGKADERAAQATAQATANARAEKINSKIRSKSDEDARTITRDADDLRLRGPGKAVCPGLAASSGTASGHVAAGGPADAAVGKVPDGERTALIALPFAPTIAFAEQCDINRSEALSWRESDRQQRAAAKEPNDGR